MEANKKTLYILTGVGLAMLGLGFASDPLYDTFCKVTGYAGTTQQADENLSEVIDRKVVVKFDSNVASGLPWKFKPDQRQMEIQLGQSGLAYYTVKNEGSVPIVGVANFNVTPIKSAPFFVKTDCFCFEEQTIQPGQELPLPVLFFVDPQLDEDKRLDDVKEITLSYTFFESDKQAQAASLSKGSNSDTSLN
ncbi:cytochrome c oxidase assembly protein subunit 11 [Litorimonas taeanensis]|uniref:Cytochrome c oxidase assembly protein CtaG n=1 Tax=Litorimonas taeanensis TaxID=568099 RepID=A0A420WE19_9PROT|nr:cytochrome c oxidase assembly protein [Litorimonas taeanensis]RKQ69269.1 cytochrome c oxidase assembly protein subunit 11 [Litorimonas taeanensis]